MRKIEKLEAETLAKQSNLEQLRREKVELENTLEQEQEALVNKLWKRMDKLEAEKRMLQIKLDQPVSDPASPRDINNGDTASNLSAHIQTLRSEVAKLRNTLALSQQEHTEKMQRYVNEERSIREENLRLQRKLQLEVSFFSLILTFKQFKICYLQLFRNSQFIFFVNSCIIEVCFM